MNVQRSQRLASLLRDEINGHLRRGVKDPRLASVSVTRVEVSGDCRNARVLYTCLGDQSGAADARKAFERAGGYLRSQLGRQLRIRQIPELSFRHDKVLHEATEVRMLIDRAVAEDVVVQRDRGELDSEAETEAETETETEPVCRTTETETESGGR
ncbi:MAG: 30S ribosome-binding factor RbfA [Myxococcota bacterium]|nr:30S ribosome-binding factor RbfA [Myxococcota bacterium]